MRRWQANGRRRIEHAHACLYEILEPRVGEGGLESDRDGVIDLARRACGGRRSRRIHRASPLTLGEDHGSVRMRLHEVRRRRDDARSVRGERVGESDARGIRELGVSPDGFDRRLADAKMRAFHERLPCRTSLADERLAHECGKASPLTDFAPFFRVALLEYFGVVRSVCESARCGAAERRDPPGECRWDGARCAQSGEGIES
jgi:hypothetical protein